MPVEARPAKEKGMKIRYNWFIEHVWTKKTTEFRVCRTAIGDSPQHVMPLYYTARKMMWSNNHFSTSPEFGKLYKTKDSAKLVMRRLAREALQS